MTRVDELRRKVESAKAKGSFAGLSIWDADWLLGQVERVEAGQSVENNIDEKMQEDMTILSDDRERLKWRAHLAVGHLKLISLDYTATADELRAEATGALQELGE